MIKQLSVQEQREVAEIFGLRKYGLITDWDRELVETYFNNKPTVLRLFIDCSGDLSGVSWRRE